MNFRKEAKGRNCMIRLEGICCFDNETTVLAHFRLVDVSGTGLKSHDLIGAWACATCHDAVDRRTHLELDRDAVRLAHLEGMVRTLSQLAKEGLI